MRFILFCIFYLSSFSSFSQHDKFFSDIAASTNTDEKVRCFVSYLDEVEIDHKNPEDLNTFFIRLEQLQPSIKTKRSTTVTCHIERSPDISNINQ